jgi:cyclic pyranopterin phosphate synthase
LPLSHVEVQLHPQPSANRVHCISTVKTTGQTGVEMEALHATSCALLTIYDMCKGIDRGMVIQAIQLVQKSGGKSGHWQR